MIKLEISKIVDTMKKIMVEKNKYYYKFILSYLIILIIPLAIGSVVYEKSLKIIEQNAIDERVFILKQSKNIIDNYIENVENTVFGLALDEDIKRGMYINQPNNVQSYYEDMLRLRKTFKSYNISKTFDSETFLILRQPDLVVRKDGVDFGIDTFYKNYVFFNKVKFEDWYKNLFYSYHQREIISSKANIINNYDPHVHSQSEVLLYEQSVPLGSSSDVNKMKGVVMVMIDGKGIKKLLNDANVKNTGNTFIVDNKSRIVISTGSSNKNTFKLDSGVSKNVGYYYQKIGNVKNLVIYTKSDYNDWIYVSVLPLDTIMGKALTIKKTIIVIVILTLIIGIIAAIYLTQKNVKPMYETFLSLRKFFKEEDISGESENQYLQRNIENLINTNEELKENMNNQEMMLKSTLIGQLIKGEISDEKDLYSLLEHLKINLNGDKFASVVISLNKLYQDIDAKILLEQDINRAIVDKVLEDYIDEKAYAHIIDTEQVLVIFYSELVDDKVFKDDIKKVIDKIRDDLVNIYNISVVFGGGNIYNRLIDINFSFSEALKALRHLKERADEQYFVWYDSLKEKQTGYYYPIELEQQLINLARCGNKGELLRLVNLVYEENYVIRDISKQLESQLYYDMKGTIIRIASDLDMPINSMEILSQRLNNKNVQEVFDTLTKVYISICDFIEENKKSHNTDLIENIVIYVNDNYSNPDLSISDVARNFSISESYFSQFFKEQTGKKFSDYLEERRLNKASELLKNSKMYIEDISKEVGYNSAYSFRRAFKRVYGVPPTEYRS